MQQTETQAKRNGKEQKKKAELVDKEVLYLTGGLYPAQVQPLNQKPSYVQWIQENMILKNSSLTNIKHWVPKENQNQLFTGEKYNIPSDKIEISQDEFNHSDVDHGTWSYDETVYLFELMHQFDNKFIVVADRFNYNSKSRDIYQIKDRYYKMLTAVLKLRCKANHPLYNYKYDPIYEQKRHYELEKYIRRTKTIIDDEKRILEDLKKIDLMIKKQENEHKNLRKILKIENPANDDLEEDQFKLIVKVHKEAKESIEQVTESFIYMRNKWINETLPVPQKVQKKLEGHIKECLSQTSQTNQKQFITENTQEQYDQLRQLLLAYLSEQRKEKKLDQDKRLLDEKVRRLKQQLENQSTTQAPPQQAPISTNQERQPPLDIDKFQNAIKKQKSTK